MRRFDQFSNDFDELLVQVQARAMLDIYSNRGD
jgi:hypothetical protein